MQTLLTSAQMRETDAYTIAHQPISSINLMENAAKAFVKAFKKEIKDKATAITIVCGQGNNGGDGLAIARLLTKEGYEQIEVYIAAFSAQQSDDFNANLKRLHKAKIKAKTIESLEQLEWNGEVIIDAILGSGLNKALRGDYKTLGKLINETGQYVVAVDVPTGFPAEGPIPQPYVGVKANLVITFQRPKINFFLPESAVALDEFKVVSIGLAEEFIESQTSQWKLTTKAAIQSTFQPRKKFSHKGAFGHALLVAGTTETMGAALLCAQACLHAGAGLTTLSIPKGGLKALNVRLPEVMALPRDEHFDSADFDQYNAIAIGPGLGTTEKNGLLLKRLLELKSPLVIDADGLNLLSKRQDLFARLPAGSIITPHLKEFDRLFGTHQTWWERIAKAQLEASNRSIVIVLKNQYTFVCLPDGEVRINPTGNPAMASGGMGDVLTGIITALLAQGYNSATAAILGVYLHGKAGDNLANYSAIVTASEVAVEVPVVMRAL